MSIHKSQKSAAQTDANIQTSQCYPLDLDVCSELQQAVGETGNKLRLMVPRTKHDTSAGREVKEKFT